MSHLEVRKATKRRKPEFLQQDYHILKRVARHWRRPRGIDSKMRLHLKGYQKEVEPGYGSPKDVRGMHFSGLWPVKVATAEELGRLDAKTQGAVLLKVGMRRRKELLLKAKELGIRILNIREADKAVAAIDSALQERKKERKEKLKRRDRAPKEEKKAKKDKLAEKVSDEEKALAEKKEKDKLLTQKAP
ncbi:50S ribosomal protein L32e [Candidatus Woesearchaeota archaeon]|nr:50S ribosomal protein L32e [Candidatus Woesearchaeota archaeon]